MIKEERLVEKFLEYVKIDSETKNEKAICEKVYEDLKNLGFEVKKDNAGEKFGSNGFNIYGRLKGNLSEKPIIFSAHVDTVIPGNGIKPIIDGDIIKSDGNTILGGDDKSGVVSFIEAIKATLEDNKEHISIEVAFSIGEEGGMNGAKNLDYSWYNGKEAIVLDGEGPIGNMTISGPGQYKINATIVGKAAHAGLCPEKGISAIMVAADAISNMNLLRIDEETTCNIGTLKAEGPTNIVSEKAIFIAEARSRNLNKLNSQVNHIKKCLEDSCKKFGATVECNILQNYESFKLEENDEFVQHCSKIYESVGCHATTEAGGGGSDANIFAKHGIKPIICSTGMEEVHSKKEFIRISDMMKCTKFLYKLMTTKR